MFALMWRGRLSGVKSDEVYIKHILDEIGFLKTHSRNIELEDLMRDKLIHAYFGISWDIVWDVIKNKLPEIEISFKTLNEKEFDQ